jgi:hypothetical protein
MFTVGVVKDIFDQLQKFLDAQDRYIEFKFSEKDYANDYSSYLEKIHDEEFWRSDIIKELKTGICSYLVVDLKIKQDTEYPEPYNYFVSPKLIYDVEINKFTKNVEYIIFRQSDFYWNAEMSNLGSTMNPLSIGQQDLTEKMICIDDYSYKVFVRPKKKTDGWVLAGGENKWELLIENPHNLGYCPVIDFWKDSIKGSNGINKIGPITLQLANLDYLLFYKACIDFMNLYGPFPVMVVYDMSDKNWDDKDKEVNTGGNYDISRTSAISNSQQTQNPRTSGRNMIAPGGGFQVPVPADGTDHDFMKNPMKFISMDVKNVELANKLIDELECEIKEKCTGIDSDYLNEIAKNSEMLAASFRKEDTILNWIASNVERVHKFRTKTFCLLRYPKGSYLGCVIDYGSDRLLKDSTTLTDEFKVSIDSGMPQGYSAEISDIATITRFCNNPEKLAKMKILFDLEPYPNMTWETLQSLQINISDELNFKIKANFVSFINRFELENRMSIVQFGSKINYSDKIEKIKLKLIEYANGITWSRPESGAGTGNNAGGTSSGKPKVKKGSTPPRK